MFRVIFILFIISSNCEAARILAVIPSPSISHQIIFRPLTQELARRGHEVVVITTDPAFTKEESPPNLTEINVHDAAYAAKEDNFAVTAKGNNDDLKGQVKTFFKLFCTIFEAEINTDEVQALINNKNQHFDLLLLEACIRPALVFSHFFKAPVILISSVGTFDMLNEIIGAPMHPFLYPNIFSQKMYNLTIWEKMDELYKQYHFNKAINEQEIADDEMLKTNFGSKIPPLKELKKNVDLLFVNVHHIWDDNRPVPPSVVYIGGIHTTNSGKELSQDLKSYLDSSRHGVIYMSFGTNIDPSMLPKSTIKILFEVFAQLPYDVLLKWNDENKLNCPKNVKIFEWLPQFEILRHSNVKLFITQGGLQSTDEAISAGVPLIGMPMLGDQWYNVEKYVKHNIGLRVDIESLTKEQLLKAIKTVVEDESYRRNIIRLRTLTHDQPQSALERAVWWTEHVLRHGDGRHLRTPAANMSWTKYLELELLFFLLAVLIVLIAMVLCLLWVLRRRLLRDVVKVKVN